MADSVKKSCLQRQRCLLPFILLLAAACATEPPPAPEALTEGVWWSSAEGLYDATAIELTVTDGRLGGVIHFLKEGRKDSEIPLRDVHFDPPELRMHAGVFTMEVRVDLARGTMTGEAGPGGGPAREFVAERRDGATVPGLLARPPDEPPYSYRRPPEIDDGWPTATPEEVGLERTALEGIVRDFIAGEGAVVHSVLVVRDGRLVLEEYFHGHGRDDLHRIASCTKSVTSLLVGLAVDRGLVAGVDTPVLDFFPAEAAAAAPGWKRLRLRHLLTMTAGLAWPAVPYPGSAGPPGTGPELFRQVLAREPAHEPGTVWSYANPDVNLLAGVLRQATGQNADAFAAEHLFAPLGITQFDWSTWGKQEGYPNVAGSLLLRPRDMAKIGALVLTEGRWRDRQVVSADWIRAATRTQVENADSGDDYGYLWWRMDPPPSAPEVGPILAARGAAGQFILMSPAERLVVVSTGGNEASGKAFLPLRVLERRLYPGAPPAEAGSP